MSTFHNVLLTSLRMTAMLLLLMLIPPILQSSSHLYAQGFTETYSGSLPGVSQSSVAWGDYDNDGDLDILLTGYNGGSISKIYQNNDSIFTDIGAGLTGVYGRSVAWGDYDNDGDLDILLTGYTGATRISKIYQNTGSGFTEIFAGSLTGVAFGSVAWGDYDNDGDLDILLTGYDNSDTPISKIYQNTGSGFTEVFAGSLVGVYSSSVAWGDYDNDGDLDILLTGYYRFDEFFDVQTSKIYQNTGSGFTEVFAGSLTEVERGSVAWGDYDNDGDLDILLTGDPGSGFISKIYQNTGSGFTEVFAGSLTGVNNSSVAWGDYDNDGDLDILLTGFANSDVSISKIYQNTGSGFTDIAAGLTGVYTSSVAWGDYDNDGDLDILLTGVNDNSGAVRISKIYQNNGTTSNTVPSAPSGLTATPSGNSVSFKWNRATDAQTASAGLTYNLRIGTSPNGINTQSPMANVSNGYRRVVRLGNINHDTSWTIKNLDTTQTYYWSVQAIDNDFAGGAFSGEQSISSNYTLTYTAGANGTITGTSPQTVNHGASGTAVTAVPNTGYHFVNWSDNSTSNPRTDANVTANISVAANFAISISITCPDNITVNSSTGFIYVGERGGSVSKISTSGTRTVLAGVSSADGVVFDSYNSILVSRFDGVGTTIIRVDRTSGAQTNIASLAGTAQGMSVDGLGNVYVANQGLNKIQKINLSTNAVSDVVTGLNAPVDVIVENATNLLISEYTMGSITRRNLSANFSSTLVSGLNAPTDIFRESDTTILVAEYDGGKITRVNLTSGVKTTVVTPGGGPHGIARDMSGNLYVTQLNLGIISKITPSLDVSPFATGLSSPAFIELSNGPGVSGTDVVYSASVTGTPTPTVTYSPASGSFFPVGTTTVTATATNDSGSASCSFTVTVTPEQSIITATAGANGSINPPGDVSVNYGTSQQFTFSANTGYHVDSVIVDGVKVDSTTSYTFTNVTANHTIHAVFAINTYSLTYTAGLNGSLTGTSPQTVNHGASGTAVTAVPNTGYHFVNWSDASTSNPRTDTNVTANISITANFAINTYSLNYTSAANGSLTGALSQTVNHGSDATAVTAVANTGYHFVNWSDASTSNPRTDANVTANISVTANFEINTYSFTVNATNGSVTKNPDQVTYSHGTQVILIATPATGYHFVNWSDDLTGSENPDTLTMDGNKTVTANFAINTYTITVNATNGTVMKNPDQANYNHGSQVVLTATPATGYHFVNWSGDLTGSENPDTLTMDGNKTVTANFAINTYAIIVIVVGNGTIDPLEIVEVEHGASQMCEVTPDEGHHVDSIVVDGVRTDSLRSYTFDNVTSAHTITAYFSINYYALTTQITGGGAIARTPSEDTYAHGTEVTLIATPNAHFNFTGWSGDTTGTVIRNDTLIVTMDSAKTIRANFTIQTYTITVTQGTNGTISPGTTTVNYGANKTFTITPDSNYEIDKALVNNVNVGRNTTYLFTGISTNHTITALFKSGTPPSSITVLAPNGNEIWRVGQTYTISWAKVNVTSVKVEYSIDNKTTWNVITSSTASTDLSWTIPNLPNGVQTTSAFVRVVSVSNNDVRDVSDAPFKAQSLLQLSSSGTTNKLNDVSMFGALGFVVGENSTILRTKDNGNNWTSISNMPGVPANINFTGVVALNGFKAWIVGRNGEDAIILSTNDKGDNWQIIGAIPLFKPNDIITYKGANGDILMLVGDNGKAFRSYDGGYTWYTEQLPTTSKNLNGVAYAGKYRADALFVIVGNNGNILLRTISQNWNLLQGIVEHNLNDVSGIDILNFWVVGNNGTILKTTNYGTTWTQQVSPATVKLNGVSMSKDNTGKITGWIVGDSGTILKYTPPTAKAKWNSIANADDEWTQVESGTDKDLTVASVTDNGSFVTVGDSGTALNTQARTLILSTPTGGGNYIAGQSLPITWSSDGVNYVKIEYSADSGQTWLPVTDVVSASAGSYNWTTPGTTAPYVVVSITDVEDSTVNDASDSTFSLVSDVAMFRTFKADTMLSKKVVTLKFNKLKKLTSGKGNIRTAAEHVFQRLKSTKGATFLGKAQTNKALKKKLGWIAFSSAAEFSKMFTAPHTGTTYPIDSVRLPKPKKSKKLFGVLKPTRKAYNNRAWEQGIVFRLNLIASSKGITPTGFGDLVLDTTSVLNGKQLQGMTLSEIGTWMDSVMTWWDTLDYDNAEDYAELAEFTSLLKNINEAFFDSISFSNSFIDTLAVVKGDSNISVKKPKNPFAMYLQGVKTASQSGGLLKYVLGSESKSVAIQPSFDEETDIPYEYELYQNYPNPFNPSTVIRYHLQTASMVTLKIYNVLGQEVITLLNSEHMEEGEYEVPFNATNFSSGVYFYRINVESVDEDGMQHTFSDIKKAILIK